MEKINKNLYAIDMANNKTYIGKTPNVSIMEENTINSKVVKPNNFIKLENIIIKSTDELLKKLKYQEDYAEAVQKNYREILIEHYAGEQKLGTSMYVNLAYAMRIFPLEQ